ncbi:hypothetical protein M406DRAFT_53104, partial [Cryphonectria parasitica EP155]
MDYSFRILCVHGNSDPKSAIYCELIERPLGAEEPTYEALSYCWGGQSLTQEIFCEGRRLMVTKNCESALRYFRPAVNGHVRRLWIDAICINQGDISEKSNQLQLMGEIYSGASRVLVWLEDDSSRILLHSLSNPGPSWIIDIGRTALAIDGTIVLLPWFKRLWI